ncbi:hypothetical protein [Clostridium sp. B9]|uniref:hypothetical protein n=1 Tax=Clostridium sp. B9 TaxID=3423224 RepID=UPI003D2ED87B
MRYNERCITQHTTVYPACVYEKCKQGPPGPPGPQGPLAPQSFVQLFDRNYTNELTANSPLNLSNEGINPIFTTGEYSLETTQVTNDTLKFPETGLYHIEISLRASFLLSNPPPAFGSVYQILFNIMDTNNTNLSSMVYNGIIPNDPNAVLENTLTTEFLLNVTDINVGLRILLGNFNFALAFENKLSVFDIIVIAQKWEKPV